MRKAIIGFLIVGTVVALSACGKSSKSDSQGTAASFSIKDRYTPSKTTPAWKLDKKKNTKLTWYINADWLKLNFGEDLVTAQIKKDLNIDVKIVTGDDTKLNTMFAGGDLPDIITLTDFNSSAAKTANKWAQPLTTLANKYDPYFNKVANEQTMNWFQLKDGKTYGYPNFSNTTQDYKDNIMPVNTNFIIREDVLKALGDDAKFDTPEHFQATMKLIKQKFPDLLPFGFNPVTTTTGSLGAPLQDWLGVPLETKEGKFYDRDTDPDYLTWVKTLNKVYRDGNITDDSFADDGPTFDEKVESGKYATILFDGISGSQAHLQNFKNANPNGTYVPLDGPQSTEGRTIGLNQTGLSGWMINYVTNNAKDPAKAIQLFTYLMDKQGQILTRYGVEGKTFQYNAEGKIEMLPAITKLQTENPTEYSKKYRLSEILFFTHDRTNTYAVQPENSLTKMQEWGRGKLKPHYIIENIQPDSGTSEARSYDAIEKNWQTSLISMLRAKNDTEFKQTLADYQSFRKENDWSAIVKEQNKKMKDNQKRLDLSTDDQ